MIGRVGPTLDRRRRRKEVNVDIGLLTMPSHPPERSLYDGQQWDLQVLRWADQLGYKEAWIGEHHAAEWEPHPAPDLLVAQSLMETKQIRLGPGGFLLPYHHPAELANRVAMLDHLAQGRLNFGVAASGLPSDWAMFNVDGFSGQNREMTRESLDIILRMWTEDEPFKYEGKYWTVEETARRSGRTPSRKEWRLVREVFVAKTDEEAWEKSVNGMMGRQMTEYFLRLLGAFGFTEYLKHDPD